MNVYAFAVVLFVVVASLVIGYVAGVSKGLGIGRARGYREALRNAFVEMPEGWDK